MNTIGPNFDPEAFEFNKLGLEPPWVRDAHDVRIALVVASFPGSNTGTITTMMMTIAPPLFVIERLDVMVGDGRILRNKLGEHILHLDKVFDPKAWGRP